MQPLDDLVNERKVLREVAFGELVDLQRIDEAFRNAGAGSDDDLLTLVDLGQSREFDTTALLFLLAVVGARLKADRLTRFRLPVGNGALNMLRANGFLDVLSKMARAPLPLLLAYEDVQRVAGAVPRPSWTTGTATQQLLHHLQAKRVLGFSLHRLANDADKIRMVEEEIARWTDPLALALLGRHLKEAAEWEVARVIIHEILANIQEHPNASTAVVAGQLSLPADRADARPGALTIAVWDDGKTIVDTLRECMVSRGTVRVSPPPDRFAIRVDHGTQSSLGTEAPSLSSDWTPGICVGDSDLLLASLLPGISRKEPPSGLAHNEGNDSFLGCGLYFLYRHVVDVFRGSLDLYSGDLKLTLQAECDPETGAQYVVTFDSNRTTPRIQGNMLVARLPTHGG